MKTVLQVSFCVCYEGFEHRTAATAERHCEPVNSTVRAKHRMADDGQNEYLAATEGEEGSAYTDTVASRTCQPLAKRARPDNTKQNSGLTTLDVEGPAPHGQRLPKAVTRRRGHKEAAR